MTSMYFINVHIYIYVTFKANTFLADNGGLKMHWKDN